MRNSLLNLDDGSHTKRHWSEAANVYINNALVLTILVLVIIFFIFEMGARAGGGAVSTAPTEVVLIGATRAESEDCITDEPCKRHFKYTESDVCEHVFEPVNTTCSNNCYIDDAELTCSATGRCTGAITDCRGYCTTNADCVEAIPLSSLWDDAVATWDDYEAIKWRHDHICELNRCSLFLVLMFADPNHALSGDYAQPVGVVPCIDFLNSTYAAESGQCLTINQHMMYTNITNIAIINNTDIESPPQFHMCTYYTNCAPLNATALELISADILAKK